MDLTSLTGRLEALQLLSGENKPTAAAASSGLQTYFFTPKSGSKHPSHADQDLKLVVVTLEPEQNLGPAKALATQVGLKDMRAIAAADLEKLLGRKREQASPLSVPPQLVASTLLITSSSLTSSSETFSVPSPIDPATTLSVSAEQVQQLIKKLEEEGAAVKAVDFQAKAAQAAAPASPAVKSTPARGGSTIAEKEAAALRGKKDLEGKSGVQLGLTIRKEQAVFGDWYSQTLIKGDMLDYYDISGCYILKPWSYGIWQTIQNFFDAGIKELGVQNAYFPMFVSSKVLEREKDHIEGFAPEVAWVTRAGQSDLEEPIAIRPTSETVMYPYYAKWIRSHRDLPLKLNQWNSVVRWEFKNPQPFLRTREFLWQEGHTAFLTKPEADTEVLQILDLYRRVYEELLAVPVIPGVKSEKEKFAGGLYTTTVEGFIPTTGRGIQGGTSHCLGQNFSKMFNISVEDPENKGDKLHVWQNSWGLSTRTIGVMVMVHGDDKGLVLPPRVAQLQVVIVPVGITAKTTDEERGQVYEACLSVEKELKAKGIKVRYDDREGYTPAFKYNDWELKGVPVRLELGPKDLKEKSVVAVRRDTGNKSKLVIKDLTQSIPDLLDTIHDDMLNKARGEFNDHITVIERWEQIVPTLNKNHVVVLPWCEIEACEDEIKKRSAQESVEGAEDEKAPSAGAKSLCIPYDQARFGDVKGKKCPQCGEEAKRWTLFGRSY
ncbi:prolyl-tRNA synthetase [Microbotryum lychnidis-dioicae p1A1 Lamole]|uniref:proline--tRNA ligase n=1 Tax=Microbotryum lychnidis-dioicae (strain p1A1 Lamole / MvSl-1064) TaxID=683840 RepID=U5H235_USTV1|nr:prolyl-tRNA synthetase [Microbotryum lychnidis-dioicae p1A1 Lamole]|eukprot:KDE08390.1 prolyl-tRNA synthetase [Microbotryum lychnidis-dioicae p1A1 Lamole]